jgi:hypothetical protein
MASQFQKGLAWLVFTAVFPVLFLVLAWLVQKHVAASDISASEYYGTGDLLSLAALLLACMFADVRLSSPKSELRDRVFGHEVAFVTMAVVAFFVFGAIKTQAVELLKAGEDSSMGELSKFAVISWMGILYAMAHTIYVRVKYLK